MGGSSSSPRVETRTVYVDRPVHVERPVAPPTEWRKLNGTFKEEYARLRREIESQRKTELNIVLIGHTGAGKSTLINTIFSISRGRIVSRAKTKGDDIDGVGTFNLSKFRSRDGDMFSKIRLVDTMGFTGTFGVDETGISDDDLKYVCEGKIRKGHKFIRNKDGEDASASADRKYLSEKTAKKNRPHTIIFVVSAEAFEEIDGEKATIIQQKLKQMRRFVPSDVAQIAVITKCDRICDAVYNDIQNIYKSENVLKCVRKAQQIFGVQRNEVFPVVNFVEDMEVDEAKSVPTMFALQFALNYACDRAEDRESEGEESD